MDDPILPQLKGKILFVNLEHLDPSVMETLRECFDGPLLTPEQFREQTYGINHNKSRLDTSQVIPIDSLTGIDFKSGFKNEM